MDEKPGDVLTIEELSAYLKIPKSTLYKLVREGKVPCQKIGRHWRFRKQAIDRWLEHLPAEAPARAASSAAGGSAQAGTHLSACDLPAHSAQAGTQAGGDTTDRQESRLGRAEVAPDPSASRTREAEGGGPGKARVENGGNEQ